MKKWPKDHPKVKAMMRKRQVILSAAKSAFLETGYSGTSMETIAQAAGVSLMTLYRHAESKDDLFGAVISGACETDNADEQRELEGVMALPLGEIFVHAAIHIHDELAKPDTTALLRLVIAEVQAFPHLAELAYRGFVTHFEEFTAWIIKEKTLAGEVDPDRITEVSRIFVDRAIGGDILCGLLGQAGPTETEKHNKAKRASDDALKALVAPS